MAESCPSTTTSVVAGGKNDPISVTRRGIFAAAAATGALVAVPALASPAPSEVMTAVKALRAHDAAYREENEDAWHVVQDRLEQRFVCSRARDPGDLARKMNFVLFEDKLSDTGAHNAMVHVMAQLEQWA